MWQNLWEKLKIKKQEKASLLYALLDGFEAFATLADVEGHGHDILAGAFL